MVYKVCIDPGHGGADPGAVGKNLLEKDITLKISLFLAELLDKEGIKPILTRTSDKTLNLTPRANIANKHNCNLFVSIHCNAAGVTTAEGIESWIYTYSKSSPYYAERIQHAIINKFPKHVNRGIKSANFHVLRNTIMPAVLVECEFINNPKQEKFLSNDNNLKKMAEAIKTGIVKGLKK